MRRLDMFIKLIAGYGIFFIEGFTLSWVLFRNPFIENINWGFLFPGYPVIAVFQFLFNDTGDTRLFWFIPMALMIYGVTVYLLIKFLK